MDISPEMLDAFAAAYQAGFTRIQTAADMAALDAWFAHNSFDTEGDEEWEQMYWAILSAAGLATSGLLAAYFQAQLDYTGIAPRFDVPNVMDDYRPEFDQYGRSPATRARFLVSEGAEPIEAITESAARVTKLSDVATRDVEQRVLAELMEMLRVEVTWEFVDLDRPDQIFHPGDEAEAATLAARVGTQYRIRPRSGMKWKRVPQARACGWCQAQSTRLLSEETKERDRGWHRACRCTWRMVTDAEAKAWTPISGAEFAELSAQRYEETGDGDE